MKIEREKLNTDLNKLSEKYEQKIKNQTLEFEKKLEDKETLHQKEVIQMNKNSESGDEL